MSEEFRSLTVRRTPVKRPFTVAVVGATGVVGRETLSILAERAFPITEVRALASKNSVGLKVDFGEEELEVQEATPEAFDGVEVAFFAAGGSTSKALIPEATRRGCVCIDKSSGFRMDPEVPLVVPTVNKEALAEFRNKKLIATPNCSTIQLVQALKPLHDKAGLKRVVVCTYQAVSGAGRAGVDELEGQVRALFNMRDVESTETFGKRIAFNALPCIPGKGAFTGDDGATTEEQKMIDETRKILGLPELKVGVTCVRVPVFNSHSEAVHVELSRELSPEDARALFSETEDVTVIDDSAEHEYPTPSDAAGGDETLIGRVRKDHSGENGLAFWVVSDNLRTGAALNAVRIAETLCSEYLEDAS